MDKTGFDALKAERLRLQAIEQAFLAATSDEDRLWVLTINGYVRNGYVRAGSETKGG